MKHIKNSLTFTSEDVNETAFLYMVDDCPRILTEWQAAHLMVMGADVWNISALFNIDMAMFPDNDAEYNALVDYYDIK